MKVLANSSFFGIDVLLVEQMVDGEIRSVVDTMTVRHIDGPSGAVSIAPTLSGPDGIAFLQSALEAAWTQGLRPAGFKDTTAADNARFGAIDAHLQDMRAIVFGKPVTVPDFLAPKGKTTDV